jgi:lipopolysaccharide transport system permease protein
MRDALTPGLRESRDEAVPRHPEIHHRISPQPMSLWSGLRELLQSRDLFMLLLNRELQVRYKQTALGVVWVILQPLVPAIIFAVVFGTYARLPSSGTPYLLFALSGLVIYTLFSGIVSRASGSIVRDSQLVTRVYFPRVVLPLASGSAAFIDFIIGLAVLLAVMIGLGHSPSVSALLVPIIAVLTGCFGLAVGIAVSALMAHYRDFGHAVPFALQLLLYASPVLYSLELLPASVRGLYALNPLVALVEAFRWAILGTPAPEVSHIVLGSMTAVAVVAVGVMVFTRASQDVADVI